MISYEPLYRLLEKNAMSLRDLSEQLGLAKGSLTPMLRKPIEVTTLVKICKYFQCDISDVICYKAIEKEDYVKTRVKHNGIPVKWDAISQACSPLTSASEALGFKSNYLAQRKKRGYGLSEDVINSICERYNLSKEDICE